MEICILSAGLTKLSLPRQNSHNIIVYKVGRRQTMPWRHRLITYVLLANTSNVNGT